MTLKNKKDEAQLPASIQLEPILNLSAAMALHERFSQALEKECPINVDAAHVEQITTPCLQVIVSAGRTWEEAGHSFSFNNPSEAVTNAFHDLGLNTYLDRWSVQS